LIICGAAGLVTTVLSKFGGGQDVRNVIILATTNNLPSTPDCVFLLHAES
jgi:hypothetical protein